MAEKSSAAAPKAMAPELKRKLAWRMAIAGLMIVVLLGALALLDRINAPDEEDSTPRFTAPVPTAKTEVTQPVTSTPIADPAGAANANNSPDKVQEKPAEPEASAAPAAAAVAEGPARPEVAAQPGLPRSAGAARGAPAASEKTARSAAPPATAPASTPAATAGRSPAAPASAGVAGSAGTAAATASQPPANTTMPQPLSLPPRLVNGYALQAGVFADVRRAEELHALLTLNGIPSTLEARVQAGPFRTRAEADAARTKLKSLGIDSVLLPPAKGSARR
jgi:cell division protein FtsN